MIKLTKDAKEFLKDYVLELGETYKEHRRGSSFYLTAEMVITDKVLEDALDDEITLPKGLVDLIVILNGTWDDDNGSDIYSFEIHSVQQIMNPKYVALMTRAQEDELLTDFVKEHCEEFITKTEKVAFEVI